MSKFRKLGRVFERTRQVGVRTKREASREFDAPGSSFRTLDRGPQRVQEETEPVEREFFHKGGVGDRPSVEFEAADQTIEDTQDLGFDPMDSEDEFDIGSDGSKFDF